MLTRARRLTAGTAGTTIATLALLTAVAGGAAAAHVDDDVVASAAAAAAPPEGSAASSADARPEPRQAAVRTDGFDPTTCHPQPGAAGAGPQARGKGTAVTFSLPATTVVETDRLGRPVAVSTNTGQAPCVTDVFVRVAPDGTATRAGKALAASVLRVQLGPDWPAGVRKPLPGR